AVGRKAVFAFPVLERERSHGDYTAGHDVMLHYVARNVGRQDAADFGGREGNTYNNHVAGRLYVLMRNLKRMNAYVAHSVSGCWGAPLRISRSFSGDCFRSAAISLNAAARPWA